MNEEDIKDRYTLQDLFEMIEHEIDIDEFISHYDVHIHDAIKQLEEG